MVEGKNSLESIGERLHESVVETAEAQNVDVSANKRDKDQLSD
jgi:hypothetical protein